MYGEPQTLETGPSGLRLIALLSSRQKEILARERNNERSIHLYDTGGYWAAFEQSACQLCRLFPHNETAVFHFDTHPFPIVMASVSGSELHDYAQKHILRNAGPDYVILTVPALTPEAYRMWHDHETADSL